MSFTEKRHWAYGFAAVVVPAVYFTWLARQLGDSAVADVAYITPLLWAIGAGIVVNIVGETFARGSNPAEADLADDRDRHINLRGDQIQFIVFSTLIVGPFALALLDAAHLWIANAIYAAYVLTAITGVVVKATLYRKGIRA